ncbi:hypothetical protein [Algisphaera agarilytica]|uniref:DUF1570 domain-containing protein n=1 Tax=Algisphaera agarilytica TaxID=1385975 RepID=A0A7X0HC13_9BACT|nr:hypothetical protein [Algisphaera agarilytica]MBB6431649.1 hypothetical protein [Algisphaera agarilytica]
MKTPPFHNADRRTTARKRLVRASWLALTLLGLAWTSTVWSEPIVVEPPVKLTVAPDGGERLRGWLTEYDDFDFTMKTVEGETKQIAWDSLRPDRVMWVQEKFLARDDARGWYTLGSLLYEREDGEKLAESAWKRALRIEPGLASKIDRVRDGEVVDYDEPEPEEVIEEQPGHTHTHDHGEGGSGLGGPVTVGDIQSQFWGDLSDEVMASNVEKLKAEMLEAQKKINLRLRLYEDASDYFLFYSDLPPKEARQWAGLLDEMYDRLSDIFGLEKGENIFLGRGLIIVFQNEADYHKYFLLHHQHDSRGTLGLCLSYGTGKSEVALFKQRRDLDFARVLVHEAVHMFNHRYRSYPFLPSWINEGLAEYVSSELVDKGGFGESSLARNIDYGLSLMRQNKSLGGNAFFYASHIEGHHYPMANLLTGFMIKQNGKRYQAFINGIKDGKSWEEALEDDYGVELEPLIEAFGRSVKIRDLKP